MKIYLNRYLQNRNFTFGKMTVEGCQFDCMELSIPRKGGSYLKHCLPPGEYPVTIQSGVIEVNGAYVRRPWLTIQRPRGFPKAGVLSNFSGKYPAPGAIWLGVADVENDEWSIKQDDAVTVNMIVALSQLFDAEKNNAREPVTLVITEDDGIIVHDYNEVDYNIMKAEQEAQKRQQEQEAHLQSLIDNAKAAGTIV